MQFTRLIYGATLAAGLAGAAHADTFVGVYDHIWGHAGARHEYVSPLIINGRIWDCLTPLKGIKLGHTSYDFVDVGTLTVADSLAITGEQLDQMQVGEVGALVAKTFADLRAHEADQFIAADQGAVWQVILGPSVQVTFDNATYNPLLASDMAWAVGRSGATQVVADFDGNTQSGGGTPEPGTWMLMLVGAAGVGAVLRRRARGGARVGA